LADNQARAAGKLQKLRQAKKDLPIAAFENDIIESVKNNTVWMARGSAGWMGRGQA
jgi:hypothetical protein